MEHAAFGQHAVVRHFRAAPSWRRIALALGAVAAVELVLLVVAGVGLLAKPVQHSVERAAQESAAAAGAQVQTSAAARKAASASASATASATAAATAAKRRAAAQMAAAARKAAVAPALVGAGVAHVPRARTAVLVLNGTGAQGAAGREAARVQAKGYRIDGVTNAARTGYTRTTIMYKPGFRAEAARLGKDLGVPLVGPLDGMRPADLGAAQLVVIVGQ